MRSLSVPVGDVELHVGGAGDGPDVVVLSGGPGCVHYLEDDDLSPEGYRAWYPEPRGVGRSGGGPHTMEQGIADLEAIRVHLGVERWIVLGHSWGSDLGLRYTVEHPAAVAALVAVSTRGPLRDRSWSAAYEAAKHTEPVVEIAWVPEVHAALGASFEDWVRSPTVWRSLADCRVPTRLIAAGDDIRPSWPMAQLAELMPHATLTTVAGVPHDFWSTHPDVWRETVATALRQC